MKQTRVQKPVKAASVKRAGRDKADSERGREDVREDVRRVWFPAD